MRTLLAVAAFALAACPLPPSPVDPGDDCDKAYGHLRAVACEPLRPSSGTWLDVCRNARRNGLFPLNCVNAAGTRGAVEACGVTCE